jgi:hypothetical protein
MRLNGSSVVPALLVLAGCGSGNGEGLDEGGQPVAPAPPANTDFQQIQDTVFTPICTACHAGAAAPRGLRLDAANSYAMLVNVASVEVPATWYTRSRVRPRWARACRWAVHHCRRTASIWCGSG